MTLSRIQPPSTASRFRRRGPANGQFNPKAPAAKKAVSAAKINRHGQSASAVKKDAQGAGAPY